MSNDVEKGIVTYYEHRSTLIQSLVSLNCGDSFETVPQGPVEVVVGC